MTFFGNLFSVPQPLLKRCLVALFVLVLSRVVEIPDEQAQAIAQHVADVLVIVLPLTAWSKVTPVLPPKDGG